jgi:alpha-glucosidase (family GH31 glycosyl hydrolase)
MKWILDFIKNIMRKKDNLQPKIEETPPPVEIPVNIDPVKETPDEIIEPVKVPSPIILEPLFHLAKEKGYIIFDDDSKNYNLNIWFIRSADPTPDIFNDKCIVFWKYKNEWSYKEFQCTTDPGIYWMTKPDYQSVAILAEGQYRGTHKIDTHRAGTSSAHKALCQRSGVVKVYRDGNKNVVHDYDVPTETGMFGINCHQPSTFSERTGKVHSSSAGCLVFAKRKDFDNPTNTFDKNTFMGLVESSAKEWGNKFSLTLCTELELHQIKSN